MTEKETADLQGDVEAPTSWLLTLSRECGRTVKLGKNGIDLLTDAAESALNTTATITKKIVAISRQDRNLSSSEEALFEELGSKIAECPGGDYLALKDDLEFWELIKQLHSIRGKGAKKAVAEDEPQQDETADSCPENSGSAEAAPEVIPEEEEASGGPAPE